MGLHQGPLEGDPPCGAFGNVWRRCWRPHWGVGATRIHQLRDAARHPTCRAQLPYSKPFPGPRVTNTKQGWEALLYKWHRKGVCSCVWLLLFAVISVRFMHGVTCTCSEFTLIAARDSLPHFLKSWFFPPDFHLMTSFKICLASSKCSNLNSLPLL